MSEQLQISLISFRTVVFQRIDFKILARMAFTNTTRSGLENAKENNTWVSGSY